jgi:hypothetical protein
VSPILFNIVADMLAILISRAKDDGQITGLVPHLVAGELFVLQYADNIILFMKHNLEEAKKQYADNTIIFMEHNLKEAKNMNLLLVAFQKILGLKR